MKEQTGEKKKTIRRHTLRTMTIDEAKQISIADYLHSLGHDPVRQQGHNLWYKSPFRDEQVPSFKVNADRNLWYDFALGEGGNLIALAGKLYVSSDVSYLLRRIAEQAPQVHPASFSFGQPSSYDEGDKKTTIIQLTSPALFSYLGKRGIDLSLAKSICWEVRFTHNGRSYFAIAFPNRSGGWEVRNKYFKGSIAPKDISLIRKTESPSHVCYLFEGFMDYLSFLTLQRQGQSDFAKETRPDCLILNSVFHLTKALPLLASYADIQCYLDNDRAGTDALQQLKQTLGLRVSGVSQIYSGCKDLNDYLINRNAETAQKSRVQDRPIRPRRL